MELLQLRLLLFLQNNKQHLQLLLKPLPNLQLLPRMSLALPRLTPFRLPKANPLRPLWHGSLQQ